DVSYFTEAAFQDDTISQAVNTVTAAGALYFSSAANSGNLTNATASPSGGSGTFEGDFVASVATVPAVIVADEGTSALTLHQFPSGLEYTTLTATSTYITLKWSDANGASANDYDLYILDSTGTTILQKSTNAQSGAGYPVEYHSCGASCP